MRDINKRFVTNYGDKSEIMSYLTTCTISESEGHSTKLVKNILVPAGNEAELKLFNDNMEGVRDAVNIETLLNTLITFLFIAAVCLAGLESTEWRGFVLTKILALLLATLAIYMSGYFHEADSE